MAFQHVTWRKTARGLTCVFNQSYRARRCAQHNQTPCRKMATHPNSWQILWAIRRSPNRPLAPLFGRLPDIVGLYHPSYHVQCANVSSLLYLSVDFGECSLRSAHENTSDGPPFPDAETIVATWAGTAGLPTKVDLRVGHDTNALAAIYLIRISPHSDGNRCFWLHTRWRCLRGRTRTLRDPCTAIGYGDGDGGCGGGSSDGGGDGCGGGIGSDYGGECAGSYGSNAREHLRRYEWRPVEE